MVTVADLPRLTPTQRRVAALALEGLAPVEIAAKLGGKFTRENVAAALYQARSRLKKGFVPRAESTTCLNGHPRTKGQKRCAACDRIADKRREERMCLMPSERRVLALKEVMREVDAGKRCAVCLMLRPCAHMGER